jgi:hypothetical protein
MPPRKPTKKYLLEQAKRLASAQNIPLMVGVTNLKHAELQQYVHHLRSKTMVSPRPSPRPRPRPSEEKKPKSKPPTKRIAFADDQNISPRCPRGGRGLGLGGGSPRSILKGGGARRKRIVDMAAAAYVRARWNGVLHHPQNMGVGWFAQAYRNSLDPAAKRAISADDLMMELSILEGIVDFPVERRVRVADLLKDQISRCRELGDEVRLLQPIIDRRGYAGKRADLGMLSNVLDDLQWGNNDFAAECYLSVLDVARIVAVLRMYVQFVGGALAFPRDMQQDILLYTASRVATQSG